MDLELNGRVALVSGGTRGIGRGIALALAAEGCRVAICARHAEGLEESAATLQAAGADAVFTLPLDLTLRPAASRFVAQARAALGPIDIVVNNVGGGHRKRFAETTDEDWDAVLELNLLGGVRLTRAALADMVARHRGAILFISSIWGREAAGPGYSLYNTTKSAAISLAKMMAIELAPIGVRVNTIAPGSIRFPGGSWDRRVREHPEAMAEFVDRELPLGRFGTVAEVAALAAFLVSDRASLITGACIPADGTQGRSLI